MFSSDTKNVLIRVTLFIFGVYVISTVLCTVLYGFLRNIQIGQYGVLNSINKGKINADMIISGSSIGQSHYNTRIITEITGQRCFNISVNGSGLGVQLPVIQWYLEKNNKPKYLLQNIDLFSGDVDPYIYQPFKYLPYLKNERLYSGLLRINPNLWLQRYTAIADLVYLNKDFQRNLILDLLWSLKSDKDYLIDGHIPNNRSWMGDKKEEEYLKEHSQGIRYVLSSAYKEYLNELINDCKKRDIQLILVVSPVKESLKKIVINRNSILDYYRDVSQQNGLWYFDLSDCGLSEKKEHWVNLTHMKSTGADQYSKIAAIEIKKRILQ